MKKVLIVDDAVYMRLSLKTILERNGFEVIGDAGSGIEAIDKYNLLKPDIVTMDITMPEMDGVQALCEIKKLDSNAKVFMVSAMGQETIVRTAIMNGAKGFILKPFKEEIIIQSLSKI